ncbi:MAG TPA: PP2C family protein-serine/threonine phosphatase [Candidatus Polarisedimenticolaceae bacterium]|nr:PP2C family protein-serine/threonine phosphatase [Candidatus Polarisedimenticolaceae bacterium]
MPSTDKKVLGDDVRLGRLLMDDMRRGKLGQAYKRDLADIYRFYLTEEQREQLVGMGSLKRFFWVVRWLIRNLLFRLSPSRRLLLLLVPFLLILDNEFQWGKVHVSVRLAAWSFLPVLIVLMLELKDKLLARDEIEVARQVQISLLPKTHPTLAGWEVWSATTPANDVGGDLIDYLEAGGGRTGLALGDVAGKGMGAALLCAKLQATLRALAPEAPELAALGDRLNGVLERSGLDNRYATLFYCEIAPGDPEIRYLNAGHNPAFVLRNGGIETLAASSLPLGMLPGVTYAQGREALAPGEAIVLYSDGITEATNVAGEEYGPERLRRVLLSSGAGSAEAMARRVLDDVGAFLHGEKPHDDQSLMVLRRTG